MPFFGVGLLLILPALQAFRFGIASGGVIAIVAVPQIVLRNGIGIGRKGNRRSHANPSSGMPPRMLRLLFDGLSIAFPLVRHGDIMHTYEAG
jgi:hypothetical protein